MALINQNLVAQTTIQRGIPRGTNGSGTSSSSTPHVDSESGRFDNTSEISQMIINSRTYQDAFQLFSSINDKQWLNRLTLIPTSFADPHDGLIDNLTGNYQDTLNNLYQDAMMQIQQLVADYYSYVNSLPSTQVQQLSDAGINAAVTGQGVTGSDVPNSIPQNTAQHDSSSAIINGVSFLLNATTGLASIASQFQSLGLQKSDIEMRKKSAFMDFYKWSTEQGINLGKISSFDQLFEPYTGMDNPKLKANYSEEMLRMYLTHIKNSPIMGTIASEYPFLVPFVDADWDGNMEVETGIGYAPVAIDATAQHLMSLYKLKDNFALEQSKFQRDISALGVDTAEYNKLTAGWQSFISQYEKEKKEIERDYINRLYNSDEWLDKLLLMKVLWNATYNTVEIEEKTNEWFNAQNVRDFIPFL